VSEATDKDKKEPELIPVGPGIDEEKGEHLAIGPDDESEQEGEEGDTRLAAEQTEDRPRRKESAKERRDRQKEQRRREKLELGFYKQRNEQLEREWMQRVQQIEGTQAQLSTAAVEQRIQKIQEQMALADNISFEALKAGTREDYQKAQGIRDKLSDELGRLNASKQSVQQRQVTQQRQVQQPAVDPVIQSYAQAWAKRHSWYDPSATDADSLVVRALDESVDQDGFDPRTTEYWEELSRRVKKRLPDRFRTNGAAQRLDAEDDDMDDDDQDEPQQRGGPKFSSGGRERPLRKGEVYISAERKKAMQDAGLWDDPVSRQRMLKRYASMDAETSASRNH
jgi:hypothetical protein